MLYALLNLGMFEHINRETGEFEFYIEGRQRPKRLSHTLVLVRRRRTRQRYQRCLYVSRVLVHFTQ